MSRLYTPGKLGEINYDPTAVSNNGLIYVKSSDKKLYFKNSSGTEYDLTSSGGTGGGSSTINELTDVTISTPSSGQSLVYNNGIWVNSAITSSGSGGDFIPLAGSTGVTGDISPSTDGGANLGSPTRQWGGFSK